MRIIKINEEFTEEELFTTDSKDIQAALEWANAYAEDHWDKVLHKKGAHHNEYLCNPYTGDCLIIRK